MRRSLLVYHLRSYWRSGAPLKGLMPNRVRHSHEFPPVMLVLVAFSFLLTCYVAIFARSYSAKQQKYDYKGVCKARESFVSSHERRGFLLQAYELKSCAMPFSGVSILSFGTFAHLMRTPIRFANQPLLLMRTPIRFANQPLLCCAQISFG